MKKGIKILIAIFCLTLVVSAFSGSTVSAESAVDLRLSSFTAERGREFTTTIYVAEGSNLAGLDATFEYDKNVVTLTKVEGVSASVVQGDGEIRVRYTAQTNATAKVDLAKLTFSVCEQVDKNAVSGWLKKIATANDKAYTLVSGAESNLSVTTNFSSITVRQVGDVYADGKINARDASFILQHVARIRTIPESDLIYANAYEDYNANTSAKINARDASLILQFVARIRDTIETRFTVTFRDENGDTIAVRSVKSGDKVLALSDGGIKEGSSCMWVDEDGFEFDLSSEVVSQDLVLTIFHVALDGGVYSEEDNATTYHCADCGRDKIEEGLPNRAIENVELNDAEDEKGEKYYKYKLKIDKNEDGRLIERVAYKTFYKEEECNTYAFDGSENFKYIGNFIPKEVYQIDYKFDIEKDPHQSFETAEFNASELNKLIFNFIRFIYISTEGAVELSFEYDTSFMYQVKGMQYGIRGRFVVESVQAGFTTVSTVRDLLYSPYVGNYTYIEMYRDYLKMDTDFAFMGVNDASEGLNVGDYSWCDVEADIPLMSVERENAFWSFMLTNAGMIGY